MRVSGRDDVSRGGRPGRAGRRRANGKASVELFLLRQSQKMNRVCVTVLDRGAGFQKRP